MMRIFGAVLALAMSVSAGATNFSMFGSPTYAINAATLDASASVANNDNFTSGNVRLEVWAFSSDYAGGALNGHKLADEGFTASPVSGGSVRSRSISGPFTPPPDGVWTVTIVWTEFDGGATNGGYSSRAFSNFAPRTFGAPGASPSAFENPQPGSFQSGIGVISGWSCQGSSVAVVVDSLTIQVPYGSPRVDTASVCGSNNANSINTGFGALVNYNRFGPGQHIAQLYVNGAAKGPAVSFTVVVPQGEFMSGLSKSVSVPNFPSAGRTTTLQWSEAQQNFVIQSVTP